MPPPSHHLLTFFPPLSFFLAANPSVQDWLSHELNCVLGDRPPKEWDYHSDFPRLKRCLSILYETLRVKTLVPEVKWTNKSSQFLKVGSQTLTLPPGTLIVPSYLYLHKHPKFWGQDAQEWKPERWIARSNQNNKANQKQTEHHEPNQQSGDSPADVEDEVLLPPPSRGNFLGWSEGARDCPAKKFSQVEWVGILAALFREWKVEPRQLENETFAETRTRVLNFIEENTDYGGLLLQLMHPERLPLVWSSRCYNS